MKHHHQGQPTQNSSSSSLHQAVLPVEVVAMDNLSVCCSVAMQQIVPDSQAVVLAGGQDLAA
jgi:hypothetical protein